MQLSTKKEANTVPSLFLYNFTGVLQRMASQEEGEEARESDEGMTNFEPYVAGKVRVSLSMVSKQRGQGQNQQRQRPVARDPSNKPPESGGISVARGLFRKIRSSLSQAASLQQPPPPATSRTSLTTSGATKRPATVATKQRQQQQAVARKQPRLTNPPPTKKVPQLLHHSSAPVLHKPTKGGARSTAVKVSPSRSSRGASPPIRGGGGPSSPREHSPLVIEGMASFGPGSGRRNRPPAQLLPPQSTNREQGLSVQSEQQRSKSEEPPSSPQWAEFEPPRALDDTSKALNKAQQLSSSSGEAHQITLVSYSDVHRHRAAAKAAAFKTTTASGGGSGGGRSSNVGGNVPPPSVKKPLNKQDLLKRIGSIENDDVSYKCGCSHLHIHVAPYV